MAAAACGRVLEGALCFLAFVVPSPFLPLLIRNIVLLFCCKFSIPGCVDDAAFVLNFENAHWRPIRRCVELGGPDGPN